MYKNNKSITQFMLKKLKFFLKMFFIYFKWIQKAAFIWSKIQ